MKNISFKSAMFAAGLAVFAGVLSFGVSVALGVAGPSEAPENATLVSPTFNGLDVHGKIVNSSGVDGPQGDGAVVVNDDLGVQNNLVVGKEGLFAGNLQTASNLTVGSGIGGGDIIVKGKMSNDTDDNLLGPVYIDDGLNVKNDLYIRGGIRNPDTNRDGSSKPVIFADQVEISQGLDVVNDLLVGGNSEIDGNADIKGTISNSAVELQGVSSVPMPVEIDDGLTVNEDLKVFETSYLKRIQMILGGANDGEITGVKKIQSGNPITIETATTEITGNLDVKNTIKNTAANKKVQIDDDLETTGHVYVGTFPERNLIVSGDTLTDDLTASGAVRGDRVGKFYQTWSNFITVGAGNSGAVSVSCIPLREQNDAGQLIESDAYLVNCSAEASTRADGFRATRYFELATVSGDVTNNGCYVRGNNTTTDRTNRYLRATAICFYPNL